MLTHQHLLTESAQLFAGRKSVNYDIAPSHDSVREKIDDFKNSSHDKISLSICDGKTQTKKNPQTGKNYQETSEGSHWTTLHLRKNQDGQITAFYADSLNNSPSMPRKIFNQLNKQGIDVFKMNSLQQGPNQCGDCSLFNAKAMDQMSFEELNKGQIKPDIKLDDQTTISSKDYSSILRNKLAKEFNAIGPSEVQSQNPQPVDLKSSQASFADLQMAIALENSFKTYHYEQLTRDNNNQKSLFESVKQNNAISNAIDAQRQTLDKKTLHNLSDQDRSTLEDIAFKLAIENSLKDQGNLQKSQKTLPVYASASGDPLRPRKPVYEFASGGPLVSRKPVHANLRTNPQSSRSI